MKPHILPQGRYSYEEIALACRRGEYRFAVVRAASGRLNYMPGVSPEMLGLLRKEAKTHNTGLMLLGSRVSGPRSRQKTLHPVLEAWLPLKTYKREASATYPGGEKIEIDKTAIKEFGPDDLRTSDLSMILVDASRTPGEMDRLAAEIERKFKALRWAFPVRVFSSLGGRYHKSESDFIVTGMEYLRSLPGYTERFPKAEEACAFRELYCAINLPRRVFHLHDLTNGLTSAVLFSASFSLGLGFHPVLPPVGFVFGLFGRYLARLRAGISFRFGDTALANAAALAADAMIGGAVMAYVISPAAGLGLSLAAIAAGTVSHTLSKGTLRLFIDKCFSTGSVRRQASGVMMTTALSFLQGAITSFVYAGSMLALSVQAGFCVLGFWLIFGPQMRRALGTAASQ